MRYLSSLRAFLATVALFLFVAPALAQVPSSQPPYNTDLGALITLTRNAGGNLTTNSAQQVNLDKNGVVCTFVLGATSGAASTTMALQAFDTANQTYTTYLTTSAMVTGGTPYNLMVYPGIQTTSLPANMVAINLALPRLWRIQTVTGGTNSSDSKVGCNYMR